MHACIIENLIRRGASVHVFKLHRIWLETLLIAVILFWQERRGACGGGQRVVGGRRLGNKL